MAETVLTKLWIKFAKDKTCKRADGRTGALRCYYCNGSGEVVYTYGYPRREYSHPLPCCECRMDDFRSATRDLGISFSNPFSYGAR